MTLSQLIKAEADAWNALMNDPRVIADPTAEHTPEIKARWEAAAEAERAYRAEHGYWTCPRPAVRDAAA